MLRAALRVATHTGYALNVVGTSGKNTALLPLVRWVAVLRH